MAPKNNKRALLRKKAFARRTNSKNVNSEFEEKESLNMFFNLDDSTNRKVDKKPLKLDKPIYSKIDVLEEALMLLRSKDYKNKFQSTLQMMFKLFDIEDSRKGNINWILTSFMDNLKELNEIQELAETCFDLLLPKELLNIVTTENANIKEGLIIGYGGFGKVTKGTFRLTNGSPELGVAVKSPLNQIGTRREAIIMSQLQHKNVVKLIAFQKKPMKIVMEYMENKSLTQVLLSDIDYQEKFYTWIIEMLSAMEYISDKQIVHRDLGTKNIFVNSEMSCKIGDFGLSCFVGYDNESIYEQKAGQLTDYNISPESILTQIFSTKSDVWAMGLLMWEMYFIEDTKYVHFKNELYSLIFHRPPKCPKSLFNYILDDITNNDPDSRPSFAEIKKFVKSHEQDFLK